MLTSVNLFFRSTLMLRPMLASVKCFCRSTFIEMLRDSWELNSCDISDFQLSEMISDNCFSISDDMHFSTSWTPPTLAHTCKHLPRLAWQTTNRTASNDTEPAMAKATGTESSALVEEGSAAPKFEGTSTTA